MKIICTQKNLINGLTVVSNIVGKNVSLPILNNILLIAKKGIIKLISTNLDIGIKTIIRGKIETEGEITIPAKLFVDYISLLNSDNIVLEKKEETLLIKTEEKETIIKGQAADEYPIVPELNITNGIKPEVKEFKDALARVLFAASYDDVRPELAGVFFNSDGKTLTIVATDSYRLAEKKINLSKENKQNIKFSKIIPIRVLHELVRNLKDEETNFELIFDDNQVVFKFDETTIVSRLIEGNYPDYKEIIPEEHKTRVIIDKTEIINNIKATSLFSKVGINDILLEFNNKNNQIKISAVNVQLGESKSVIKAKIDGENNSAVFNYKYLLDGLQNIKTKNVIIELVSSESPVILKPENETDYLYLIMPIRK